MNTEFYSSNQPFAVLEDLLEIFLLSVHLFGDTFSLILNTKHDFTFLLQRFFLFIFFKFC